MIPFKRILRDYNDSGALHALVNIPDQNDFNGDVRFVVGIE